jgi:hypothetical protein
MRTVTVIAGARDFTKTVDARSFTVTAKPRDFTVICKRRNLGEPGTWYTQDDTSWDTWGQTNIRVFWPGYTKTFGELL